MNFVFCPAIAHSGHGVTSGVTFPSTPFVVHVAVTNRLLWFDVVFHRPLPACVCHLLLSPVSRKMRFCACMSKDGAADLRIMQMRGRERRGKREDEETSYGWDLPNVSLQSHTVLHLPD